MADGVRGLTGGVGGGGAEGWRRGERVCGVWCVVLFESLYNLLRGVSVVGREVSGCGGGAGCGGWWSGGGAEGEVEGGVEGGGWVCGVD